MEKWQNAGFSLSGPRSAKWPPTRRATSNISRGRVGYLWSLRAGAACKHKNSAGSKMDFSNKTVVTAFWPKGQNCSFWWFYGFLVSGFRSVSGGATWDLTSNLSEGSPRYLWSFSQRAICKPLKRGVSKVEIRENPIFCDLLLEVGSDPLAKNGQSNTLVGSPRYLWSLGQCAACNNKIGASQKWKIGKILFFGVWFSKCEESPNAPSHK